MRNILFTMMILCSSITSSPAREQIETSILPRAIILPPEETNYRTQTIALITDVVAHSSDLVNDFEYLIYGWALIPSDYENEPAEKVSICIDSQYYTTTGTRRYSELNSDFCPACRSGIYATINSSNITAGSHEISLYWKDVNVPNGNGVCTSANSVNKIYSGDHEFTPHTINMSDPNIDRVVVGSNGSECNSSDPLYSCNGTVLSGFNGNDLVFGLNGDDRPIVGGDGKDVLFGIKGDDVLKAGNGNDRIYGGADNDRLRPGGGIDWLYGGFGEDSYKIISGFGINYIIDPFSVYDGTTVNSNFVKCKPNAPDDPGVFNTGICYESKNQTFVIFENDGALIFPDNLETEAILDGLPSSNGITDINSCLVQDDTCDMHYEPMNVAVFGTMKPIDCTGNSTCITNGNYEQELCNNQNIHLSYDDDVLQLGALNNFIDASSGNDVICAGQGNDVIIGGTGDDWLFGQDGDDKLIGGIGDDVIEGGLGDDIYVYHFNDGHDIYIDNQGNNKIYCLGAYGTVDLNDPNKFNFVDHAVDSKYEGSITLQPSNSNFTFYGCAE